MMEKLAERLSLRPQEASGEGQKKGLRWYHKALVVPALALAIFGASLTAPDQARADHESYWGSCYSAYGMTWYGQCLIGIDHATGQHYELGVGYWETNDRFAFNYHNDTCHTYVWIRGGGWLGPFEEDFCRTW